MDAFGNTTITDEEVGERRKNPIVGMSQRTWYVDRNIREGARASLKSHGRRMCASERSSAQYLGSIHLCSAKWFKVGFSIPCGSVGVIINSVAFISERYQFGSRIHLSVRTDMLSRDTQPLLILRLELFLPTSCQDTPSQHQILKGQAAPPQLNLL